MADPAFEHVVVKAGVGTCGIRVPHAQQVAKLRQVELVVRTLRGAGRVPAPDKF